MRMGPRPCYFPKRVISLSTVLPTAHRRLATMGEGSPACNRSWRESIVGASLTRYRERRCGCRAEHSVGEGVDPRLQGVMTLRASVSIRRWNRACNAAHKRIATGPRISPPDRSDGDTLPSRAARRMMGVKGRRTTPCEFGARRLIAAQRGRSRISKRAASAKNLAIATSVCPRTARLPPSPAYAADDPAKAE